jgi:DNA invertase Pin-like site-specific DNA recombinase
VRRVVGYVRVSTEAQATEGVSLDAQRARLIAYCAALGYELVAIETDAGASARSLDRDGLRAALARLDNGDARALAVVKLDRLTRSVRDLAALVERYFHGGGGGAELLSVSDSIDTHTAAGRLVLNVLVSVAQWEREATAERTREALATVRATGGTLGAAALGWRRATALDARGRRTVETVESELVTIARAQELRALGGSLRTIAATLTAEGHPTKRGGRWSAEHVRCILARTNTATRADTAVSKRRTSSRATSATSDRRKHGSP